MIQKLCTILCLAALSYAPCLFSTSSTQNATLNWETNYEKALARSKETSKPIILFFMGSDWCTPCHQFEDQVFNSQNFINSAANKFVFMKVDLPRYKSQDPAEKVQNNQLLKKYEVNGFPTVIVIDPKHNQQTRLVGFQSGESQNYADQILRMIRDYSTDQVQVQIEQIPEGILVEEEEIPEPAKELTVPSDGS